MTHDETPKKPEIAAGMQRARDTHSSALDSLEQQILLELIASAFVDPQELVDEHGTLRPIVDLPEPVRRAIADVTVRLKPSGTSDEDGRPIMTTSIEITLKNKKKALNLLGKHVGLFKKPKRQRR